MKDANKIQQYIENNQNDEAIAMIEAGYDVNQVDSKSELLYSIFTQGDHETETPLYTACRVGNKEMITYLLANGADPNLKNEACEYPLEEYLVEHMGEDDGIIEAFVDAGVDLNLGRTVTPFCAIMNAAAPMTGGMLVFTALSPAISCATPVAKSVSRSWLNVTG